MHYAHNRHNKDADPFERSVRRIKSAQQDLWDGWLMRKFARASRSDTAARHALLAFYS